MPPACKNCKLTSGLFENTLSPFMAARIRAVALLHIDCDLYNGTKTFIETCHPYIRLGTVICFDEYSNHHGNELHEMRAWHEYRERCGMAYKYLGFLSSHQQFSIRIR